MRLNSTSFHKMNGMKHIFVELLVGITLKKREVITNALLPDSLEDFLLTSGQSPLEPAAISLRPY